MPACPSCGADLIPPYRFCGRCGAGVAPPPAYAYYPAAIPPKKDNVAIIIAVVLVVLVVGSVAASAILYVMVSGLIGGPSPGGPSKPVMTLQLSTRSNLSAVVLVTGVQPATSPSNFKANIGVGASFGSAVGLPISSGGTALITVPGVGTFQLSWLDVGGDGLVSGGDRFSVVYPGFMPSGTTISLIFIWTDGSSIASVTWQA